MIGVVEQEVRTQGTVYSTVLLITLDATIMGRHRNLKPMHTEPRSTSRNAEATCDTSGHYSRPDVFTLLVNSEAR